MAACLGKLLCGSSCFCNLCFLNYIIFLKETPISLLGFGKKSVFEMKPRGCFAFAAAECPSHAQKLLT